VDPSLSERSSHVPRVTGSQSHVRESFGSPGKGLVRALLPEGGAAMSRLGLTICTLVMVMLWGSHPVSAYVWKCQTPQGEMWTSEPNSSDDCQEYDAQYNPSSAPPVTSTSPSPVSGSVVVPVPVPVPAPFYGEPYVYPPYYAPGYGYYYGPPAVIIRPPFFGYPHGRFYGGHWRGGHRRW